LLVSEIEQQLIVIESIGCRRATWHAIDEEVVDRDILPSTGQSNGGLSLLCIIDLDYFPLQKEMSHQETKEN